MIRMTDTKDLIGPLPEMPKTPVAPTPWRQASSDSEVIYDASNAFVVDFGNSDLAALVVKLVNAAAAEQAPAEARQPLYYLDGTDDKWWELSPGLFSAGYTRNQAAEYRNTHGADGMYVDWPPERIANEFNGATPVYE